MTEEHDADASADIAFEDLPLSRDLLETLKRIGYTQPSPIQAQAIPPILEGHDIIGQAQTGTGKTAAFSLPILSMIEPQGPGPKALILAPTRELAVQVQEAIDNYGQRVRGVSVTVIYGGTDINRQLRELKRGPAIVVGTPGRIMDHMRRGSLKLSNLTHFVLDEADEMLRMGFFDDVEWILEHAPDERQTLLFSATMPPRIAAIARDKMRDPRTIKIRAATATVESVRQRFIKCSGMRQKLEVLGNLLQSEECDATIVFVRTKIAASDICEALSNQGVRADAIHGDITQHKREKAIQRLKKGQGDVLVATDVAARGLDVDRISHVINFDIPEDAETYIHRIGRTGRYGKTGEAILLVGRRDQRLLRDIERATRQRMEPMHPPSRQSMEEKRRQKLEASLRETLEQELADEEESVHELLMSLDCSPEALAAALLHQLKPASANKEPEKPFRKEGKFERGDRSDRAERKPRAEHGERAERSERFEFDEPKDKMEDSDFVRYRISVGKDHGVKPSNIVGAIANEAGLNSKFIGRIDLYDDYSLVDLPPGMPREILRHLRKVEVFGQRLEMEEAAVGEGGAPNRPSRGKGDKKKRPKRRKG